MTYSTQEVTQKLGLSKDTLRYYEKEGLLPLIERNQLDHLHSPVVCARMSYYVTRIIINWWWIITSYSIL